MPGILSSTGVGKFQTNIDAQYMNQYRACISLWVIKLTVRAKFLFLKVSQLKLKAAAGKHIRTFLFQKQINIYFLSNLHSFMVWEYSKMYVNCRYNLKASMWKWKDYLLFKILEKDMALSLMSSLWWWWYCQISPTYFHPKLRKQLSVVSGSNMIIRTDLSLFYYIPNLRSLCSLVKVSTICVISGCVEESWSYP